MKSVLILSDGRILVGGSFASYDGERRERVARLNGDGSLDTTFMPGGVGASGTTHGLSVVLAFAVQSDNRILIGGSFTSFAGSNRGYLARLNN